MNLIDFYIKAIKSVGLTIDEDNFVCEENNGKLERVMYNKKQILLPTSQNLRMINDNSVIFNPLEEDSIRGINPSMIKFKSIIDRKLSLSFNVVAELISVLGENLDIQKKASLELNKFLSSLNVLRQPNMKNNIVDEAFVLLVKKINAASLTKSSHSGSVYIKIDKGKVLDGEKFNKVASLALPIYEDLKENKESVFDIVLKRKKDAGIYAIITEFIIGTKDDNSIDYDKYNIGSSNLDSPTFIVVYKLYYKIAKRINSLLKSLSFVNKEIAEAAMIDIELELDDLVSIGDFAGELKLIPNLNAGSKKVEPALVRAPANMRPTSNAVLRPGFANTNEAAKPIKALGSGSLLRPSSEDGYYNRQPLVAERPRFPIAIADVATRPTMAGRQVMPRRSLGLPLSQQRTTIGGRLPISRREEYSPFSRSGGFGF